MHDMREIQKVGSSIIFSILQKIHKNKHMRVYPKVSRLNL